MNKSMLDAYLLRLVVFSLMAVPVTTCINIYHPQEQNDAGYDNYYIQINGELRIIQECIKPHSVVFDVGASIGEWSQSVINYVKPIKLYSFEPIPDVFMQLERNLRQQGATLTRIALSNTVGTHTFVYYQRNTQTAELSGFFQRPLVEERCNIQPTFLTVQTDTIDHFCYEQDVKEIDFLKIDTEGAELLVLQGAQNMLKENRIKLIQFEYGGTYQDAKATLYEVYQLLTKNGYSVFRIVPEGLVAISKWYPELENYRYSNYLATCPEKTASLYNP